MEHPELFSEVALIERALQPEQFRFLVVQYNHTRALSLLTSRLHTVFAERAWMEHDCRAGGGQAILQLLQEPPEGLLLLHHAESILDDEGFTRSLNQRRDALSRHSLGLILLLPSGGNYLQRLARAMPDLWSLRNLVAELYLAPDPSAGGQFITQDGKSYFSFSSQAEAREELDSLKSRIAELETLPGNRPLLALLLARQGKIQLQLSDYYAAEASFALALDLAREIGNRSLESASLTELGEVMTRRGDYETALQYLEQSLAIAREIGDKSGEGITLNNFSMIYSAHGDYATALSYLEQSLAIQREIGDKYGEGTTLNNLSQIYNARGDYAMALNYLEHSLTIMREIRDKKGEGATLNNISQIFKARGDYSTTLSYLEQSLVIQREIGDKYGEGTTLNNISQIYDARGDYATALSYLEQSLAIRREIGDINGLAITLWNTGDVFLKQGKMEAAIEPIFQAYTIFDTIGSPNKDDTIQFLNAIRSQLGEARFQEILSQLQTP